MAISPSVISAVLCVRKLIETGHLPSTLTEEERYKIEQDLREEIEAVWWKGKQI